MAVARPKVLLELEKKRFGRGFSRGELKNAGLSSRDALRFKIPVDSRRKTLHEENVEVVRALLKKMETSPKPTKAKRKAKS